MVSNSGLLLLTTFFAASFVSNCQRGRGRGRRQMAARREAHGRPSKYSLWSPLLLRGRCGGGRLGGQVPCQVVTATSERVSPIPRGDRVKRSEERNGEGNSWRPRDYGDLRTPALNYINCHQMRARSREAETSPGYTSA